MADGKGGIKIKCDSLQTTIGEINWFNIKQGGKSNKSMVNRECKNR